MQANPRDLVVALADRGLRLATAESLTGGLVAAAITSVPGSSQVYGGGVVSYATEVKVGVLGVPEDVVAEHGVVSAECARAMAQRARELMGTDLGLSTTGVAGPDRQEGKPVGTAFVGVADAHGAVAHELHLEGDRLAIQQGVVTEALSAVLSAALSVTGAKVSRDTEDSRLG